MLENNSSSSRHLKQIWALACSLKLAISLASAATFLIMAGSLVMHFNPVIFGSMEQQVMAEWLPTAWQRAPLLVSWVPLSGICIALFAINTLCCTIDWLLKVKTRWRKTGEYLIHTGFILLTVAYIWGGISGFRSGPHRIFPGERIMIPEMPEYSLHLKEFTPQVEPSGRPLDMVNELALWKGQKEVVTATVKINHPLIYDGLVVLPTSFGQELQGFRFQIPAIGFVNLTSGSRLPISNGLTLVVEKLLPNARRSSQGAVMSAGTRLVNPAMQLSLQRGTAVIWRGWHFLREPTPDTLTGAGVWLRPVEPIYRTFSLLTINRDPGDKTALLGGVFISFGVIFALFSFYRKRSLGDRPEV